MLYFRALKYSAYNIILYEMMNINFNIQAYYFLEVTNKSY